MPVSLCGFQYRIGGRAVENRTRTARSFPACAGLVFAATRLKENTDAKKPRLRARVGPPCVVFSSAMRAKIRPFLRGVNRPV